MIKLSQQAQLKQQALLHQQQQHQLLTIQLQHARIATHNAQLQLKRSQKDLKQQQHLKAAQKAQRQNNLLQEKAKELYLLGFCKRETQLKLKLKNLQDGMERLLREKKMIQGQNVRNQGVLKHLRMAAYARDTCLEFKQGQIMTLGNEVEKMKEKIIVLQKEIVLVQNEIVSLKMILQ